MQQQEEEGEGQEQQPAPAERGGTAADSERVAKLQKENAALNER